MSQLAAAEHAQRAALDAMLFILADNADRLPWGDRIELMKLFIVVHPEPDDTYVGGLLDKLAATPTKARAAAERDERGGR